MSDVYFENVVSDATRPHELGRFWESLLGTETLTDEPAGYETRLEIPQGPVIDLGFQRVPAEPTDVQRLHFVVRATESLPPGEATDPAGNRYVVREADPTAGPLAAFSLAVADVAREQDFWQWLTGWQAEGVRGLQHPSGRGPALELRPEEQPKGTAKNRIHLDLRLEPGDDTAALAREIAERGGRELHLGFGDLPWRHFADPSGNEFCLLPSRG